MRRFHNEDMEVWKMKIKLSRPVLALLAALLVLFAGTALADGRIAVSSDNFPDEIFRAFVSERCDLDQDGFLSADERETVTELYLVDAGVTSLQGAECFTGLTNLTVVGNSLTALDLSAFPSLRVLACDGNRLTALDLSSNTLLEQLSCTQNSLTSLDLSANTALTQLECYENEITALDLSACVRLENVICAKNLLGVLTLPATDTLIRLSSEDNLLTSLDVTGCTGIWEMNISNNRITSLDLSHNPSLELLNAAGNSLTSLDLSHNPVLLTLCVQCTGLESLDLTYNEHLRYLDCGWNSALFTLDVSNNPSLRCLICCGTGITNLDLSNNRNLRALDIHSTGITELDISSAIGLTRYMSDEYRKTARDFIVHGDFIDYDENEGDYVAVICGVGHDADTAFTTAGYEGVAIDGIHFPDDSFRAFILDTFDLDSDQTLSRDEILGATEMYAMDLDAPIFSLQGIEYFTELTVLGCAGNQLETLDMSYNTELRTLACFDNQLTDLDLRYNDALESIGCSGNRLTSLNLSNQPALTSLECYDNDLETLDVSSCALLTELRCERNALSEINLYGNPALVLLTCYGNLIETVDVSACPNIVQYVDPAHYAYTDEVIFYGEDIGAAYGQERGVKCDPRTQISGGDPLEVVRLNEAFFPDGQFLAVLSTGDFDWNQDGVLHGDELLLTDLILEGASGITSLRGIEYFPALTVLNCSGHPVGSLDLSGNPELEFLSCDGCALQALDVSGLPALQALSCTENQLTELNVEYNTMLTELLCYVNSLTALDVSQNTALIHLDCSFNQIASLDVSRNAALEILACEATDIQTLDISACPKLVQYVNEDYFSDNGVIHIYGIIDPDLGYLTQGLSCYAAVNIIGGSPVTAAFVLYLPGSLTELEESALEGTAFNVVMIPGTCAVIGPRAFADCGGLRWVHIPGNGIQIADTAFEGSDHVTILTNDASVQAWADAHGVQWREEYYEEW